MKCTICESEMKERYLRGDKGTLYKCTKKDCITEVFVPDGYYDDQE